MAACWFESAGCRFSASMEEKNTNTLLPLPHPITSCSTQKTKNKPGPLSMGWWSDSSLHLPALSLLGYCRARRNLSCTGTSFQSCSLLRIVSSPGFHVLSLIFKMKKSTMVWSILLLLQEVVWRSICFPSVPLKVTFWKVTLFHTKMFTFLQRHLNTLVLQSAFALNAMGRSHI